ncbi:TPA: RAQPRD family integrative conjugative element protein [Salmonella enterica]|nr:conjugal transfer protein [Salmonella enterica subsp. enterica serovar Landwasser]HCL5133408.1 RAQPRD family integrative conjugative element protein [Salmonella enterica]
MKSCHPFFILSIVLCPMAGVFAAPLTEREELTLSLNQLSQIEASLHRAQQSARTGINERYYFDYPRIHSDISTLRSGIEHYLTPSRAQPRDTATLVGQYREEKTTPIRGEH